MGDSTGRVESLRTCLGAVHNGLAAVQLEADIECLHALLGHLIATVFNPAISLRIITSIIKTIDKDSRRRKKKKSYSQFIDWFKFHWLPKTFKTSLIPIKNKKTHTHTKIAFEFKLTWKFIICFTSFVLIL